MEIWKYVPNTNERLSVSNLGRVKSNYITIITKGHTVIKYREKILAQNKKGYNMCGDYYTHRVVAELFVDNPNNYNQVHHIDGDIHNNNASNLEWVDAADHTRRHKTGVKLTEEHKAKLSAPNPKKARYGCANGR